MGRETVTRATWKGTAAEVKLIAEGDEIILRGAIKAKLPRSAVTGITLQGDSLAIEFDADQLILELGAAQAQKWHDFLLKPAPTLAQKLGISPQKPAFILGAAADPALVGALTAATVAEPAHASCVIALIESHADLKAALECAARTPALPVWCIYPKGPQAKPGDADIRIALRAAGFMDNKACAVSQRLTATRYALSAPRRP